MEVVPNQSTTSSTPSALILAVEQLKKLMDLHSNETLISCAIALADSEHGFRTTNKDGEEIYNGVDWNQENCVYDP